MPIRQGHTLSSFLKSRRKRLDPAALGYTMTRRRTPGLRREEVAQRANISTTWYTWLEQGRGGAPSSAVLERIAHALLLTETEREHLFLLGVGHPPRNSRPSEEDISPRLQRVLDALERIPAIVKNVAWDVVAWNQAATVVMSDYPSLAPEQRNVLRMIFCNPQVREAQLDWDSVARFMVETFRADIARNGCQEDMQPLIDELIRLSPDFEAMWIERNVRSLGEGTKRMRHPTAGLIALEYSTFAIDGRSDLGLMLYNPATAKDRERIDILLEKRRDDSTPAENTATAHHE